MKAKSLYPIKILCVTLTVLFLLYCGNLSFGQFLYLNASESLPLGIYFKSQKKQVDAGDLVLFSLPQELSTLAHERTWLSSKIPFLKPVVALAGDQYCIEETGLKVGDMEFPIEFSVDYQGRGLPRKNGCFQVQKDCFLPASSYSLRSFDGRYFGEVSLSSVVAVVRPLFTFSTTKKGLKTQ